MQNLQKVWQVQVQGQIYEAEFEELKQWIVEGSVLPSDNVRRGDLRWLPAEKVPALLELFARTQTSSETAAGYSPTESAADEQFDARHDSVVSPAAPAEVFGGVSLAAAAESFGNVEKEFCRLHADAPTEYACDICESFFCKSCPKSFGGKVKICPLCGSLCRHIDEAANAQSSVGAIHKPYTQADEAKDLVEKNQNVVKMPSFWKSLGCSAKYYKNFAVQSINRKKPSR